MIAFEADEVVSDIDKHTFYIDGEVVGEFERKNIAGYFESEMPDDEEE